MSNELMKKEQKEVTAATAEQLVDAGNAFTPDMDIYQTEDALVLVADVPGVKPGDVELEVDENNVLSVRAKTSFSEPSQLVARQFRSGNYFRAFTVSSKVIDKTKISATLRDGVLEVTIPKREEVKPRRIQINA